MRSNGPTNPDGWAADLAAAVRSRRKQLGLTQLELSAMAGCGPVFVYDLESGRKATFRLDKLLDVLGVLGLQLALEAGKQGFRISGELK